MKFYSIFDEVIVYVWEDVKVMFNGGSRKKMLFIEFSFFYSLCGEELLKKKKLFVDLDVLKEVF